MGKKVWGSGSRLNKGKKVMYILDFLKDCALKLKATEVLRKKNNPGDKGMFLKFVSP